MFSDDPFTELLGRDHRKNCPVCGKRITYVERPDGTCSAKCSFELQKAGQLEHIAGILGAG